MCTTYLFRQKIIPAAAGAAAKYYVSYSIESLFIHRILSLFCFICICLLCPFVFSRGAEVVTAISKRAYILSLLTRTSFFVLLKKYFA